MPSQIWLQCQTRDVQKIKAALDATGRLDREQKVQPGKDGQRIIPTRTRIGEEGENADASVRDASARDAEVLGDLGISLETLGLAIEVLYLPAANVDDTPSSKPSAITTAISEWLESLSPDVLDRDLTTADLLLSHAPKRWSVYAPMLLLPSASFHADPWPPFLQSLPPSHLSALWQSILLAVSIKEGGPPLTHLAINSGIPLSLASLSPTTTPQAPESPTDANILRTPSGLLPLHGDFGPLLPPHRASHPTGVDFTSAFWVATKQNGIWQTWAPRYTMFSRGNVKEKARVLRFHGSSPSAGTSGTKSVAGAGSRQTSSSGKSSCGEGSNAGPQARETEATAVAIDLYAGIGYFTFSYAAIPAPLPALGPLLSPILAWELNPWSVEGLRRGALLNNWSCTVFKDEALTALDHCASALEDTSEVPGGGMTELMTAQTATILNSRITVFQESNTNATSRLAFLHKSTLRAATSHPAQETLNTIRHINLGLLPSSRAAWRLAWDLLPQPIRAPAWLHIHENVAVAEIARRATEIEMLFRAWAAEVEGPGVAGHGDGDGDGDRDGQREDIDDESKQARKGDRRPEVQVEHVEQVKTFAPGVWHCVFDLCVSPARPTSLLLPTITVPATAPTPVPTSASASALASASAAAIDS